MSQIFTVNPEPGIEGNREPQPCFVPTISWLKHPLLPAYTHTQNPNPKQIQSKQTATIELLAKPTWYFADAVF